MLEEGPVAAEEGAGKIAAKKKPVRAVKTGRRMRKTCRPAGRDAPRLSLVMADPHSIPDLST